MEPRYLLDTNICIYIRQKRPDEVLRRFRKLRPGEAVLSVITYGELLYGAAKSHRPVAALERPGAIGDEERSEFRPDGVTDLWITAQLHFTLACAISLRLLRPPPS